MPIDIRISVESIGPPVKFRIGRDPGEIVRLFEIRVNELGDEDPHWWIVQEGGFLAEMVDMHLLTEEEARRAGPPTVRPDELEEVANEWGTPVEVITYGEVPLGMRQEGRLRQLVPGRLYEVQVFGPGVATLEFYG